MTIEVRSATAADLPQMGQILYDAFYDIATKHGFPPDFPSVEFATQVSGLFVQQEDVHSVVAADRDRVKGSNHLEMWDDVASIGPISVDVTSQGEGIGRTMMLDAIAHAKSQGFEMVRLVQDAFNMQSLALYASVGFVVQEPMAYLALSGESGADADVRAATPADLDAIEALCRASYHVSRRNEVVRLMQVGFPAFVLDRGGRITGYQVGTAIGHGVAETEDDALTLLASSAAMVPDSHSFVPLRNGELYRRALAAGHRNVKVVNLMSYGPYEPPVGTFLPSVFF
jgi:predicted N-acetyltransferase YhbS